MLQLLRTNQPLAHILIPVIIGLGLLPVFEGNLVPWSYAFVDLPFLNALPLWAIYCIQFGLIWIASMLSNRLFNTGHFSSQINNFPEFTFAILSSAAVLGQLAVIPLMALNFVLLGLSAITKVYRQNQASSEYFTSAIWFGFAAIAWKSMAVLLPMLLVCIVFTRAMNWREYFVALVGFFLPFFWLWALCYLFDAQDIIATGLALTQDHFTELLNISLHWYDLAFAGVILLLILLSLRSFIASYAHSTNQSKNTKSIVVIAFFSLALSGILTPNNSILTAAIPAMALVIPFFFIKKKIGIGTRIMFYFFLFSAFGKLIGPFAIDFVRLF